MCSSVAGSLSGKMVCVLYMGKMAVSLSLSHVRYNRDPLSLCMWKMVDSVSFQCARAAD